MLELNYISGFLIGLAGGVHCIGMCGGIASAFRFAIPKGKSPTPYIASYNIGRILSYTLAGAVSGLIATVFSTSFLTSLAVLQIISIVFLVLLALYISDIYKGLSFLERLGAHFWKKLLPFANRLIPFKNPLSALGYGMIWGWLPCGLIYTALTWSMASGSATKGALFMLCFGLGTLPALVASSIGAGFLVPLLQKEISRYLIAILLLVFAVVLTLQLF